MLDNKTWQNLAIAFSRLAQKPELLLKTLQTLENFPEFLKPEELKTLAEFESDEGKAKAIQVVQKWDNPIEQLDIPERILWILGRVPHLHAKLQCGMLVVGHVREQVAEARLSAERVSTFCHHIRSSTFLRKCISISLLFGNVLNTGTNRANAVGVVLPEALLRLEDLRASKGSSDDVLQDGRELTCLDFVAEALITARLDADSKNSTAGGSTEKPVGCILPDSCLQRKNGADCCLAEAEQLLKVARPCLWGPVSLEEASSNTANANAKAASARALLSTVPVTPEVTRLGERVRVICDEAIAASNAVTTAKNDLLNLKKWSTTKDGVKTDEWFKDWELFFNHLLRALDRARARAPKSCQANTTAVPTIVVSDLSQQVIVPLSRTSEGMMNLTLAEPAADAATPTGSSNVVPSPCRAGLRAPRLSMTARAARRLRESATGSLEEGIECMSDVSDWGSP
jgi:hypothetical protein